MQPRLESYSFKIGGIIENCNVSVTKRSLTTLPIVICAKDPFSSPALPADREDEMREGARRGKEEKRERGALRGRERN